MTRREFIQTTALAAAGLNLARASAGPVAPPKGVHWPVGCFNRPWVDPGHTIEMQLDGIKAAGYRNMGLLTPFKDQPFIDPQATQQYLENLKQQIAARDLKCVMAALHTKPGVALPEAIANARKSIDHAKVLGVEYLLTFGVDQEKDYEDYYAIMGEAAPYAHAQGMKLVLKPHGGGSGAAEEILRCIQKVNQPNFKIWYDAGNIIYYTGKDPVEQLKPIVQHVTGFCAKDCAGEKGEIWLDFGRGKVDFLAVFKVLADANFYGPVMVECCAKGKSVEETAAGARRNREQLEKWFAEV